MATILQLAPLSVLLIEDNPGDALLLEEQMKLQPHAYRITHVQTLKEAASRLEDWRFDVALLDLSLPDVIGFSALMTLQNIAPALPIIMLTAHDDQLLAYRAVERGAQDYLIKDQTDGRNIMRAIRYAIQRKRFEQELVEQANFDKLTGLSNRTLFESRLDIALSRSKRSGQGLGVFFLDLDRFKAVNDTLGHASGDRLLQQVGARLKSCVRPYDTIARFGGDEFALLMEGIRQPRDCAAIAQKITQCMAAAFELGDEKRDITVSIGIATYFPDEGETVTGSTLLQQADQAMYHAKGVPFSFYQFYTESLQAQMKQRMDQENELRHAMSDDQMVLYYQPKITLKNGEVAGVEAMLRWMHPTKGQLLPHEFLSFATEAGMVTALDLWVLRAACSDLQHWRKAGMRPLEVSVNISGALLDLPELRDNLASLIKEFDVQAGALALEIPEHALLEHEALRTDVLAGLRALGVAIHLDHFGGEAVPLRALRTAPLDALKIDCNSLGTLSEDAPTRARMLDAMIALAKSLDLSVIATGVENRWQQSYLRDKHCEQAQGFALARPMPASYLQGWIAGLQSNEQVG